MALENIRQESSQDTDRQLHTITNSAWFWIAIYCGFGAIMLAVFAFAPRLVNGETAATDSSSTSEVTRQPLDTPTVARTRDQRSFFVATTVSPLLALMTLFAIFMLVRQYGATTKAARFWNRGMS
jgi:hypothetical protein